MPSAGSRMGSNRSMFDYILQQPKKPLKVKVFSDTQGHRVEGKKPQKPKKRGAK